MKAIMSDTQKFLNVALAAMKKAEPVFRKSFGKPLTIGTKGHPRDWVTNIDKEIEQIFIAEIKKNFPEHEIVGEEFSATLVPKGKYVWYLDPIDGTTQYIHGIPFCCISAALVDEKGPLIGVISNPETGELFHAIRGGGAFKNGKKISVSTTNKLTTSLGGIGWTDTEGPEKLFANLVPLLGKIRVFASSALQLCLVGDGRLDSYVVTGISAWDVAAGILIAAEAGGKVSDFKGSASALSSPDRLLVTNGKIHAQFLEAIRKSGM